MTDQEKLKKLLIEFGVEFTEDGGGDEWWIDCEEGDRKVGGYNCFYTRFTFKKEDGSFISMGAWE